MDILLEIPIRMMDKKLSLLAGKILLYFAENPTVSFWSVVWEVSFLFMKYLHGLGVCTADHDVLSLNPIEGRIQLKTLWYFIAQSFSFIVISI